MPGAGVQHNHWLCFKTMLYPVIQNGRSGYIRRDGSVAVRPQFQSAMSFSEGFAGIQRADKWGFINLVGEIVIEPIFTSCRSFAYGLAFVEDGDSKFYIDTAGQVVFGAGFYRCGSFEGDLAPVMPDIRSSAFIDRTGKIVLSGRNYLISHLSDGLINCPELGKWGFINVHGEFEIAPQYVSARPFREGLAAVALRRAEAFCFIDTRGQIVIEGEFNGTDIGFSGNLCAVWKKHYGFIDRSGRLAIPYRFYFAGHFSEGLAVVKEPGSKFYGYADEEGTIAIKQTFTCADAFEGDLAQVIVGEEFDSYHYGYIDRNGEYVWEPTR
jgi:hypothetical protein